jgi:hypothetical protein
MSTDHVGLDVLGIEMKYAALGVSDPDDRMKMRPRETLLIGVAQAPDRPWRIGC